MCSKLIELKKLLPVFPQGEDFKYFSQMLEYRDTNNNPIEYICISSNKELPTNQRIDFYYKCYDIIENSSNPNVKIHSLSTQSKKQCELFPFTSSDATSWILNAANGCLYTDFGTVLISDVKAGKKDNVLDNVALSQFTNYVEKSGYNINELSNDYKKRIYWNIDYLGDWSDNTYEYKGTKSFKQNRLF